MKTISERSALNVTSSDGTEDGISSNNNNSQHHHHHHHYLCDPKRYRPPARGFHCGERVIQKEERPSLFGGNNRRSDDEDEDEEDMGGSSSSSSSSVLFYCSVPPSSNITTSSPSIRNLIQQQQHKKKYYPAAAPADADHHHHHHEDINDDINDHIMIAQDPAYFRFLCRKRSVGVLLLGDRDRDRGDNTGDQQEQDDAPAAAPAAAAAAEDRVKDEELEATGAYEAVDPNFFDAGYTLAGATGFQVWAGTRLLLESLVWPVVGGGARGARAGGAGGRWQQQQQQQPQNPDHPTLVYWQQRITQGRGGGSSSAALPPPPPPVRILELGAGVGVLGINLAAAGAEVLLTDLSTLVDNATYPNLLWNRQRRPSCEHIPIVPPLPPSSSPPSPPPPPSNGGTYSADQHQQQYDHDDHDHNHDDDDDCYPECPEWLQSATGINHIGKGWAAAASLDWTQKVKEQLLREQYDELDLIVASDCVWLVSMLDSLLDTVQALFTANLINKSSKKRNKQRRPAPTLLLSFQRRDSSSSSSSGGVEDGGGGDDSGGTTSSGTTSSSMFTTVDSVIQSVQARGWSMECLAWRTVQVEEDDGRGVVSGTSTSTSTSTTSSRTKRRSAAPGDDDHDHDEGGGDVEKDDHTTVVEKEVYVFAIDPVIIV